MTNSCHFSVISKCTYMRGNTVNSIAIINMVMVYIYIPEYHIKLVNEHKTCKIRTCGTNLFYV